MGITGAGEALLRNLIRLVLCCITSEIAQSAAIDIAYYFIGCGKGIADIGVTVFHRSPEIKGRFVDITIFHHNRIAMIEKSIFLQVDAIISIDPFFDLKIIDFAICKLVVVYRGQAGIKKQPIYLSKIAGIIAQTGRINKTPHQHYFYRVWMIGRRFLLQRVDFFGKIWNSGSGGVFFFVHFYTERIAFAKLTHKSG